MNNFTLSAYVMRKSGESENHFGIVCKEKVGKIKP